MSTYQCDACGHYIVQPLTDKPTYHTCEHDGRGTFQLIPPDLSLLTRLAFVKGKEVAIGNFILCRRYPGVWHLYMIYEGESGQKLQTEFSGVDLPELLIKAYKWCKEN